MSDIKNFDLKDAIRETVEALNISVQGTENIIKKFLEVTEDALAERGSVHYMHHFSIMLKKRRARKGTIKTKNGTTEWETPDRVEPEFEASKRLKEKIGTKQGLPCA